MTVVQVQVQGLRNAKTRSHQSQPAAWMNNLRSRCGINPGIRLVVIVMYSASK